VLGRICCTARSEKFTHWLIAYGRVDLAHASAGHCAKAQLFEVRAAITVASTFVARASFNLRQAGCSLTRSNSALPVPVGVVAKTVAAVECVVEAHETGPIDR
jgi:hypothetical protein